MKASLALVLLSALWLAAAALFRRSGLPENAIIGRACAIVAIALVAAIAAGARP